MKKAPLPGHERERLAALHAYQILDTAAEQQYDDLVELAAHICEAPIALITLIDEKRQWFKARVGLEITDTERDVAFCAHAILERDTLVVEDALQDERFADNPLVIGDPKIRFYAGSPLITPQGHALGTLCVIDRVPRKLSMDQEKALRLLGHHVIDLLEMRQKLIELRQLHHNDHSSDAPVDGCEKARQGAETPTQLAQYQLRDAERARRALLSVLEDQKQVEEKLRRSEAGYRHLFENNPAPMLIYACGSLELVAVNDAFCRHYGYSKDQALKLLLTDLYPADEKQRITDVAASLQGLANVGEWHHLRHDGSTITIVATSHDTSFAGRKARIAVLTDISERKRAEQALGDSEQRLRLALEAARQGLYDLDMQTGEAVVSPEYATMLGYDPDGFHETQTAWHARLHPVDAERVGQVYEDYINGRIPEYRVEYRQRTQQGAWKWILSIGKIQTRDVEGRPLRMLGTHTDIDALKNAEQGLLEQKAILDRTGRLAKVGGWEFDAATGKGHWSEETARIHGITATDPVELEQGLQFYSNGSSDQIRAAVDRAIHEAKPYDLELELTTADGSIKWVRTIGEPVLVDGTVEKVVGAIQDITTRHRIETALAESEQLQRLFIEHAPAAIAMFDHQMRYIAASTRWLTDYGLQRDEIIGRSHYEVLPDVPERWKRIHQRALAGEVIKADEDRFERADGQVQWLRWEVRPWFTTQGKTGGLVIFAEDINARKQAEEALHRLNEELEQRVADRTRELQDAVRELETFTYSVSHDLKAPLRGIDGYSRLLLEDHADRMDDEGRTFLHNVRHGVEQMNQLIEDLLAYSRMERRSLRSIPINLHKLVSETLEERRSTLHDADIEIAVEVDAISVDADPDGLLMVMRNLIDNAIKFCRESDHPAIQIKASQTNSATLIQICDNGIGFDMRFHERVFEIFQRLQRAEEYEGTGIGLAIVRKAINRMGGRVWAQSSPGQGACFFVEVPR